ncbi:MAG: hypothetical protein ACR2GR_01580 [Rhodothermales bacterium]
MASTNTDSSFQLARLWWLVLLRAVVSAGFAVGFSLVLVGAYHSPGRLAGAAMLAGGLLEIVMAFRLRREAYRALLGFSALVGIGAGGGLLAIAPMPLALLMTVVGLWMAAYGFVALWLVLSMDGQSEDRWISVAAALVGVGVGVFVMVGPHGSERLFAAIVVGYTLASAALSALAAFHVRKNPERWAITPISEQL